MPYKQHPVSPAYRKYPTPGLWQSIMMLILLFYVAPASSQNGLKLFKTVTTDASMLYSDALGNFYLSDGRVFSKYDPAGNLLKTYSNNSNGRLWLADPTDPLKIMLFYGDFSRIVYLNQDLVPQSDIIDLSKLQGSDFSLACVSFDNAIWLYEPAARKLCRYNSQLQLLQESGDISQLSGVDISPLKMTENNQLLYLNDTATGFMIFDRYGAYLKTLPFRGMRHFQIYSGKLFMSDENSIQLYDPEQNTISQITIGSPVNIGFRIENKRLFVLKPGKLEIYIPE